MLKIKNLHALELFAYVKTDEGKDLVENWVYGKALPGNVSKHVSEDFETLGKVIDANVKKICAPLPSKNVLKQLAIDKFILEKKDQLNLTWEQTQNAWNNIMVGLILKTIQSKDFVWNNGKIESIAGLDFLNET
jgi:hypothetical protein